MSLLSDEEIAQTTGHTMAYLRFSKVFMGTLRAVAEAQHAKDQKRIEQVFGGIEALWEIRMGDDAYPYIKLDYGKYQQFKAKIKEGEDEN